MRRIDKIKKFFCVKKGSSRYVIFIGKFVIKIPYFKRYSNFLWGLIANLNEVNFYKLLRDERLCPILFYLPFGLLLIMPKVKIFSVADFENFDYIAFISKQNKKIPAEYKPDSYGYYNGRVVTVDYG